MLYCTRALIINNSFMLHQKCLLLCVLCMNLKARWSKDKWLRIWIVLCCFETFFTMTLVMHASYGNV